MVKRSAKMMKAMQLLWAQKQKKSPDIGRRIGHGNPFSPSNLMPDVQATQETRRTPEHCNSPEVFSCQVLGEQQPYIKALKKAHQVGLARYLCWFFFICNVTNVYQCAFLILLYNMRRVSSNLKRTLQL